MGKSNTPVSDEDSERTCSFDICCNCKVSCCQDAKPPLTSERKAIIQNYLHKKNIRISDPFGKAGYDFPAVDAEGFCVFYDKATKKCRIHAVKPESCLSGPITFDVNCETGKIEWFLKKGEICAFAEKLYQSGGWFEEHLRIAKEELLRLVHRLDPESLRVILRIDEPCTFKIGEDYLPKEMIDTLLSERSSSKSEDSRIS